jgi:hypothetical protein
MSRNEVDEENIKTFLDAIQVEAKKSRMAPR